jgi:hypothetical protein
MFKVAKTKCCNRIVLAQVLSTVDDEDNKKFDRMRNLGLRIEELETLGEMGTCACQDWNYYSKCPKCLMDIDPGTCYCGNTDPRTCGEHTFTPIGCQCNFNK